MDSPGAPSAAGGAGRSRNDAFPRRGRCRYDSAVRAATLRRDQFRCTLCIAPCRHGCEERCAEGARCLLTSHHLRPRWAGGEDATGNTITLCRRCHRQVERLFPWDPRRGGPARLPPWANVLVIDATCAALAWTRRRQGEHLIAVGRARQVGPRTVQLTGPPRADLNQIAYATQDLTAGCFLCRIDEPLRARSLVPPGAHAELGILPQAAPQVFLCRTCWELVGLACQGLTGVEVGALPRHAADGPWPAFELRLARVARLSALLAIGPASGSPG